MNECLKLQHASHVCAQIKVLHPLAGFLRHIGQFLFAAHIGTNAEIGEGCLFQHNGLGVVISEYARIGTNCIIYQHVTIGARGQVGDVPVIGNNVLIGAGAILLGAITVGNDAKIGAGSVVLNDVPSGATVVGYQAKMILENNENKYE